MIRPQEPVSIARQCALLAVSRAGWYKRQNQEPSATAKNDLKLAGQIDEIYLKWPFYGTRRIRAELVRNGFMVGRDKVRSLMKKMGIHAVYPRRKTSVPDKEHKVYPYLLRHLKILRPNQVWCADITYLRSSKGFYYLVCIMDWHSRRVLAWSAANSLHSMFCEDALAEALARYGTPEIFNTDQGCQFTADSFTALLQAKSVAISMDGRGRWLDNVMIERLWRSLKTEWYYLHAYEDLGELKKGLAGYMEFYNFQRPHQSLGGKTPDEVYQSGNTSSPAGDEVA